MDVQKNNDLNPLKNFEFMRPDEPTTPLDQPTQDFLLSEIEPLDLDKNFDLPTSVVDPSNTQKTPTSNNQKNNQKKSKEYVKSTDNTSASSSSSRDGGDDNDNSRACSSRAGDSTVDQNEVVVEKVSRVEDSVSTGDSSDGGVAAPVNMDGSKKVSDIEKVSHSAPDGDVVVEGEVLKPKRKRGRPKGSTKKDKEKKLQVVPSMKPSSVVLNRTSAFYVNLYSQMCDFGEVEKRFTGVERKTVAEFLALDLLMRTKKGDKDAQRTYWQIAQKNDEKMPKNDFFEPKNGTLLDDMLTEVEGVVFGEIVDKPPTDEVQ